jgi:hypothetical protein
VPAGAGTAAVNLDGMPVGANVIGFLTLTGGEHPVWG